MSSFDERGREGRRRRRREWGNGRNDDRGHTPQNEIPAFRRSRSFFVSFNRLHYVLNNALPDKRLDLVPTQEMLEGLWEGWRGWEGGGVGATTMLT